LISLVISLTDVSEKFSQKANYELLEAGTFYGEISEGEEVWGNGKTLESCREDLQDALEGWIILGFRLGHKFPI
jgi:predicted RNase H-like HicB family nuclease